MLLTTKDHNLDLGVSVCGCPAHALKPFKAVTHECALVAAALETLRDRHQFGMAHLAVDRDVVGDLDAWNLVGLLRSPTCDFWNGILRLHIGGVNGLWTSTAKGRAKQFDENNSKEHQDGRAYTAHLFFLTRGATMRATQRLIRDVFAALVAMGESHVFPLKFGFGFLFRRNPNDITQEQQHLSVQLAMGRD